MVRRYLSIVEEMSNQNIVTLWIFDKNYDHKRKIWENLCLFYYCITKRFLLQHVRLWSEKLLKLLMEKWWNFINFNAEETVLNKTKKSLPLKALFKTFEEKKKVFFKKNSSWTLFFHDVLEILNYSSNIYHVF